MSAEHLELVRLIMGRTTTAAVERILAAGYRKPQQVTTVEELDALPVWSVVLSGQHRPPKIRRRRILLGGGCAVLQHESDNPPCDSAACWGRRVSAGDPLTPEEAATMKPYEREQGGWWEYGSDAHGADKVWRALTQSPSHRNIVGPANSSDTHRRPRASSVVGQRRIVSEALRHRTCRQAPRDGRG